jgi:hypothetical protein
MNCVELEMACFLEEAETHNKEYEELLGKGATSSSSARTQRNKILENSTEWRLNIANTRFACLLLYNAFKLAKPELDCTSPAAAFLADCFDNVLRLCVEPFTELTLNGTLLIV